LKTPLIRLDRLSFLSRNDLVRTDLEFATQFSFIYGASNTGKSFAVKALDFMLGGSLQLPSIKEREPYNRVFLNLQMPIGNAVTLERSIVGGDFRVHHQGEVTRTLGARHNKESDDNLSNSLLRVLGIRGKEVAQDKSGTKKPLSFRDIVRFCITDETSIQSETSPALSGENMLASVERNIFKFMLTGEDDAALITHAKPKDFRIGRTAQVTMLESMIAELDAEISEGFPDRDTLDDALEKTQEELISLEREIGAARTSIRTKLEEKKRLAVAIGSDQVRVNDIFVTLENFDQLMLVYESDVARLEAIEEAGFLLGLDVDEACPLCGAPPDAQVHERGVIEIEKARSAAEIEIAKIKVHKSDLAATINDTRAELEKTGKRLLENSEALTRVEADLLDALPTAEAQQRKLSEIIPIRDRIRHGIALISRRNDLEKQKQRVEKDKPVKRLTNFQEGLSNTTAQEFAAEVGKVLTAWGFPGEKRVFFDIEKTFDLIIDGKQRKDNGKGVRAITHAAFKVAILTFCQARNLPHPGFLILDTPLITYRDPMQSRGGSLEMDEQQIRKSDLKERMFEHLGSLATIGQLIIFDNADPPSNALTFAAIEAFTNDPTEGRQGLL
jgi:hypothetical protein